MAVLNQVLFAVWLTVTILLVNQGYLSADEQVPDTTCRSDFTNSRIRFSRDLTGHVAFIGGSITEMNGYRPLTMDWLTEQFPRTKFHFTDAGISSTCSTAGAFRLESDVLSAGTADLFFIEFAVNDDQDANHSLQDAIRGMEGILRHLRTHSPNCDIVMTYFVNPEMMELIKQGKVPVSIAAHETVAKRYEVSTVNLANHVTREIQQGALTWEQYGGVHPSPYGNAIPAKLIAEMISSKWKEPLPTNAQPTPHPLPELIDQYSYTHGNYLNLERKDLTLGWDQGKIDWSQTTGQVRARHRDLEFIACTTPGKELTINFTGTAIGVECLAGPDAGTIEFSIDGGERKKFNLAHRFSKSLHYPRTVLFDADLAEGEHTLRMSLTGKQSDFGHSPAARILHFVVNE